MFPQINFDIALDKFIQNSINNKEKNEKGFIDDKDCETFVLSILYKLEPIYKSINVDRDIKENILVLWNQLIKKEDYNKSTIGSFNISFNQGYA